MATDLERLTVQLEASVRKFERELNKARTTADKALRGIEADAKKSRARVEASLGDIGRSFRSGLARGLGLVGLGIGSVEATRAITSAAAEYVNLQNALKVAGLEGAALERTFASLYQIAQRNGTALGPLTTLYSRATQAQKELRASSDDLLRFTDGVSLALRVAGSSSQEAAGALLQLSQALGSGVVRAEEFNSVNEGARPILQAVAAGLKEAGGSVATLKTLVNDGKVSSEAFFRAFLAGMPLLEQSAAKAQGTVAQATERAANAFVVFIGELDKTVGASQRVAENINAVASAIERLAEYINSAAGGLANLQGWFTSLGNHPFWRRLGELAGADFSAEGIRAAGLVPLNDALDQAERVAEAWKSVQEQARAGSMAGYQPGATKSAVSPVSLADYKVPGAKDRKGRSPADRFGDDLRRAQEQIAMLERERESLGLTTAAREKARKALELELAAKRAGLPLTDEYRAKIEQLATAYGQAEAALETARQAQQDFVELQQFIGQEISSFFSDIVSGGENAEEALMNLVKRLADAALQAALLGQGPLASLLGLSGSGGQVGGIIGALFKGFAGGGYTGAGGKYEPAGVVHRGEYVFDKAAVARLGVGNLEALRRGAARGFADGGYVDMPRIPAPVQPRGGGGDGLKVVIHEAPGTEATASMTNGPDGKALEVMIRNVVLGDVAKGGDISRGLQSRFGLGRMRGR